MDLVIDIGNSAAKGALFAGDALERAVPLALRPATASEEDWYRALREAVAAAPERVAFCSVVPQASERARAALRRLWHCDAFAVSTSGAAALPFELAYRTPSTLGADRLAAAAAGWVRYGADESRSVLVVDAGTALTYEAVRARSDGARYEGGAIAPGPALLQNALAGGTAQLPSVPLALPPSPIGATTREALQSGLLYSFLDGAAGMIGRFEDVLGPLVVVSTGGWGAFLQAHVDAVAHYAPHLVLRGVHLLHGRQAGTP